MYILLTKSEQVIGVMLTLLLSSIFMTTELKDPDLGEKMVDNNEEVKIGDQIWMSTNLSVDTFQNGDIVTWAKSAEEWAQATKNKTPAWCYLNYDSSSVDSAGIVYNFYAVKDPRGLAPAGWHIPSNDEWGELNRFLTRKLGNEKKAAVALMSPTAWFKPTGEGANSTGFNAIPLGRCTPSGVFLNYKSNLLWLWHSSVYEGRSPDYVGKCSVGIIEQGQYRTRISDDYQPPGYGHFIRCVKDE